MKFVESKPDAPSHTSAGAWEFGAPKPGRSDRDPALGIETDSAESPPRYAKGVGTGARPANDKAPVTFDEGLELPVQDRFGGLADDSRGCPMGVRWTRVVNGEGPKPRFQGRWRGTNTPSRASGVAGDVLVLPDKQ